MEIALLGENAEVSYMPVIDVVVGVVEEVGEVGVKGSLVFCVE